MACGAKRMGFQDHALRPQTCRGPQSGSDAAFVFFEIVMRSHWRTRVLPIGACVVKYVNWCSALLCNVTTVRPSLCLCAVCDWCTMSLSRKIGGLEHGWPGQCAPHIHQRGCVRVLFPAPAARRGTVRSGTECRDCTTGPGGAAHAGRSHAVCHAGSRPHHAQYGPPRTPPHPAFTSCPHGMPGLHDNTRAPGRRTQCHVFLC